MEPIIQYKYFSVSGGHDDRIRQWFVRLNSLLQFALAASYCISYHVNSEIDVNTEILRAAILEYKKFVDELPCQFQNREGYSQFSLLPNLSPIEPKHDLQSLLATFVDSFSPILPDQGISTDSESQPLMEFKAQILRPVESSEYGVVLEFDCRLPYRMQLDLALTNTPLPLPRCYSSYVAAM